MKWMIASDLHGSAYYCKLLMQRWAEEQADTLIFLGDILYHGPRNDLPRDYAPKEVIAMLNPLADKLLVCSALICLIELNALPAWMVIIIISREFIISGFRLIASDNGVVIAASYWGKFKTTFQMVSVVLLILDIPALAFVTTICVWIALLLTIVSLVDYIYKNHKILTEGSI